MNEKLNNYYNKFNEDKRLTRRHGIVEYETAMKYIHKYLKKIDNPKICDIGAGTGKYSIALENEGYDVTAVFDTALEDDIIGVHPMQNDATLFMGFEDMRRLIENSGFKVVMYEV